MKTISKTKRTYRKQPRRAAVETYYLPLVLLREIERRALEEYGGNKSALVTTKLAEALEVELEQETVRQIA